MFSRFLLTLCLPVLMIFPMTQTFSQEFPRPEKGISRQLARWRVAHYSDVRYKLNLKIEKMSPVLKGAIEISVKLKEPAPIILDWRKIRGKEDLSTVADTELNGQKAEFAEENEHLIINGAKQGENLVKLDFTSPILTSGGAITRYIDKEDGAEYIYSLFVPSDASTAFPCFDQPDLKARFSLEITAPSNWNVVSNSSLINNKPQENRTTDTVSGATATDGIFTSKFKETLPISTYVFAFAVGNFQEVKESDDESSKIKNQRSKIYLRKSQAEKFKPHAQEVFRLNRQSIKYLEEYFDYKFPFPKYDLVLIPEFPFGGMEHAGCTFLREDRVIFPSEPTANDYITRANLIFHENSHQWFGDLVTMKWFDDLWLKEGFAEFTAYKTLEKILPQYNAWKTFYERNKLTAYLTDSTKGTTPIYQEINNLNSAKSAYGNIVYRKAPAFLRQAEFYLGEREFQTAVRAFLKKYEFKNAEWQDLVNEFELVTKKDLKDWAKTWVTERGLPIIRVTGEQAGCQLKIYFEQKNSAEKDTIWGMKANLLLMYVSPRFPLNNSKYVEIVNITREKSEIFKDDSICANFSANTPSAIFPNYQDYGYGIFILDSGSREYILRNLRYEKDDFLRSMMYGSLWDSVREAELNPRDYVELVIKNIGAEKDEMIVLSLLNRVNTALAYYLDDKTHAELSPKLEEILVAKMQKAETLGRRITFYRAFLNLVNSENGKQTLKEILREKFQIPNFKLKTKDKFDIVAKLLILNDKDAPALLTELEKTETGDEAERYAYAAKAGIPTAENKARYWQDFVENKEISESRIEAAFVNFNAVRHADLTQSYLERALAELPKLKTNRKIFFVNGWLSAFIGGQRDEKAMQIVNKFLADNPNLDNDLRLKILENADVIERSVKIRAKWQQN